MNTHRHVTLLTPKNTIMKTFFDMKIQKIISEKCNKINNKSIIIISDVFAMMSGQSFLGLVNP